MRTFFALLAVIAVVAAFLFVIRRVPVLARFLAGCRAVVGWPVIALCRGVSAVADFILLPRGSRRRIAPWRYLVWLLVGLLPMALFFAELIWPLPLPVAAEPGYLLVFGALVHLLIVTAAFLTIHDDFDVMDGVVDSDARRIGGIHSVTRPAVIAISVGFVIAYAVVILYWLAEVEGFALFDKRPHTGFAGVDYVLTGLRALPTEYLLALLDRVTGNDTSVVFADTVIAQATYFSFLGVGSVLLLGLVTIAVQEAWQLRRIVTELGESDARRDSLIQRAALAPPVIRRGILRAAVTPAVVEKQKRLIVAAKEIGIFTLPQTFCHHLESFDPEIQTFGLDQCLGMFRHRAKDFEAEQCETTFRKAAHVLRRGKLQIEPLKKLLRLMTSIMIVKRGVVQVPDTIRGMVAATIKKELEKPRANEDPALRGFLRDLQSALTGSQPAASKPAVAEPRDDGGWLKRLPVTADPVVPPDSPAPTVH